jgi:hypothetical protein
MIISFFPYVGFQKKKTLPEKPKASLIKESKSIWNQVRLQT